MHGFENSHPSGLWVADASFRGKRLLERSPEGSVILLKCGFIQIASGLHENIARNTCSILWFFSRIEFLKQLYALR